MKHLIDWMIQSSMFRKASSLIGGFAAGLWFSAMYWRQIRDTLEVWGCPRALWLKFLLGVATTGIIGFSFTLTAAKKRMDKEQGDGSAEREKP